ncbi:MAG: hypothetical protein V3U84_07880 [Thiotrichaceae bacterium]
MKHLSVTTLATTLTAILLAFGSMSANALDSDAAAILAAIDGEADVVDTHTMDTERVNFDISSDDVSSQDFWHPANAGALDDSYY